MKEHCRGWERAKTTLKSYLHSTIKAKRKKNETFFEFSFKSHDLLPSCMNMECYEAKFPFDFASVFIILLLFMRLFIR